MKVAQKNTTDTDTLPVCLPHPPNAPNLEPSPPAALSINSGTGNGCPDRKMLYIKVTQNGSAITNTLPATSPRPSNIPNIDPPLRTVSPMNCPKLLQYPEQIISNTKVVRNSSTTPDT